MEGSSSSESYDDSDVSSCRSVESEGDSSCAVAVAEEDVISSAPGVDLADSAGASCEAKGASHLTSSGGSSDGSSDSSDDSCCSSETDSGRSAYREDSRRSNGTTSDADNRDGRYTEPRRDSANF